MGSILAIHLIESPDYDDFYANHLETDLIRPIAQFCDIPFTARTVLSREYFIKALDEIEHKDGCIPVLHFAGHGNVQGIGLSDGDLITWADLREMLIPVNERVGGTLLACMSCCQGLAAIRSAMSMKHADPYVAIIGTAGKPTIAETSVAYATFYHQFNKLYSPIYGQQPVSEDELINEMKKIIKNMRDASLHREWGWLEPRHIKAHITKAVLHIKESLESRRSGRT